MSVPENSYGKTYGLHREFLEFNISQHKISIAARNTTSVIQPPFGKRILRKNL